MTVCRFYQQGYCRYGSTKVALFFSSSSVVHSIRGGHDSRSARSIRNTNEDVRCLLRLPITYRHSYHVPHPGGHIRAQRNA